MIQEKSKSYLEELYKISELMSSTCELEDLLNLIMDSSIRVTKADQGSLMLLDEKKQILTIKVAYGLSEATQKLVRIKIGEPIAGLVAKEGKPLLLTHQILSENPRFSDLKERKQIKSALSVPLKVKDEVIGVLNLNHTTAENSFTQEDISPMTIFAAQAAVAIENAMLFATAQKHTDELIILNKIGKLLTATFDQGQVVKLMSKTLEEMIKFDVLALLLLNPEQGVLNIISSTTISEKSIEEIKSHLIDILRKSINWRFDKNPIIIQKEIKTKTEEVTTQTINSTLSLPLVAKDETIGAVSISSFQPDAFTEDNLRMLSTLAPQVAIALENARIYLDMQELYTSTVEALASEIETRNPYTRGHSERVTHYSAEIAKRLGFNIREIETIKYAGLLHDLGKIGISDDVLLKPGKLTDEEYEQMKHHPIKSESILRIIAFLREILPIVRHHHEHYNGKGYPDGLKGEQIPLGARIIAVADAFDAITSDRPYRQAKSMEEAVEIIKECTETQFDPQVVQTFLEIIAREEEK
ncbi:MAG: GAF domain-containing protein [bacterium]|nr:GAF domain-containing protein [bacterium]